MRERFVNVAGILRPDNAPAVSEREKEYQEVEEYLQRFGIMPGRESLLLRVQRLVNYWRNQAHNGKVDGAKLKALKDGRARKHRRRKGNGPDVRD